MTEFLFSQLHLTTRKIVPWKKYSSKYRGPSAPGERTVKISTEIITEIASPRFQKEPRAALPNSKKRTSFESLICTRLSETHVSSNLPNKNLTQCPRQLLHQNTMKEKHTYRYSIFLSTRVDVKETA